MNVGGGVELGNANRTVVAVGVSVAKAARVGCAEFGGVRMFLASAEIANKATNNNKSMPTHPASTAIARAETLGDCTGKSLDGTRGDGCTGDRVETCAVKPKPFLNNSFSASL